MNLHAAREPGSRPFLAVLLVLCTALAACSGGTPPPRLPVVHETEPSERLPIDGLWKVRHQETEVEERNGEALWEGSDAPRSVQLERGRMYLQAGFGPNERHGTLVVADIHQSAPTRYRCRRPVRDDDEIVWRRCQLFLGDDRLLHVETDGVRDELVFELLVPADGVWLAAQADAWHILSAREAHKPAPEVPVISPVAVVPDLPPPPARTTPKVEVAKAPARTGRFRALVIGSADYTYLPGVATADEDAEAVSRLLETRYSFEVTHLRNPSLSAVLGALDRQQRELGPKDSFLLYWAGHGTVSDELGRCYWVPVEAMGDDPTEGLSNDDLASTLGSMKAKHVLVVADSCFTAGQRREAGLARDDPSARKRLSKRRARVALTSGGLEPIQDGRGGGHSVFTGAFLAALQENSEAIDGTTLFADIRARVTGASQTPEYADIRGANHGGGDFVFIPAD